MRRRLPALLLTLALCGALSAPACGVSVENQFPFQQAYHGFQDVIERDWFYPSVRTCYETGLMNGTGTDEAGRLLFAPAQVLTVGEVAAIAARMNETLTGEAIVLGTPAPGETIPWYQWYTDYLERLGVSVPDGAKQATRLEFVQLLSPILSDELLERKNNITALPDTADPDVLLFYNAGILTGIDKWGTFAGDKGLSRSECAAMVARIVRTAQRQSFTPADPRLLQAAGFAADDVLFRSDSRTVTAGEFLPEVAQRIAWLEGQSSGFNWNNLYGEQTYREYVLDETYKTLGVSERNATELYQTFDVQVFYSKRIDLRGRASL